MSPTFKYEATEVETARILAFQEEHLATCGESTATIGEHWKYTMVPTSLGGVIRASCLLCHKEQDCTEYESW